MTDPLTTLTRFYTCGIAYVRLDDVIPIVDKLTRAEVPPGWTITTSASIEPGHLLVCAPLETHLGFMSVRPDHREHANRLLHGLSAALVKGIGNV